MCQRADEKIYFDCHGGRCYGCNFVYARDFIFFKSEEVSGDGCPICLDTSKEHFLKYACGHCICVDCYYPKERMEGPDPIDFDPDFFSNQAEDITNGISDDLFDRWQEEDRPEYHAWDRADEEFHKAEGERIRNQEQLLRRCPKCRHEGLPVAAKLNGEGKWIGILSQP